MGLCSWRGRFGRGCCRWRLLHNPRLVRRQNTPFFRDHLAVVADLGDLEAALDLRCGNGDWTAGESGADFFGYVAWLFG